jgi:GNAT superfamily N-acetyltransferase
MLFASAGLALRIEREDALSAAEAAHAHARLYPESGAEAIEVAGGQVAFTFPGSPLTHAIGVGLACKVDQADLERIEHFYCSRGCASVNIDVTPFTDPTLWEAVASRGYRVVEFNNVLARWLRPWEQWPVDPRVRRANRDECDLWSRVAMRGFFEGADPSDAELAVAAPLFGMASALPYFAYASDVPAGGALMSVRNAVAYLMADGVAPAFRGRGLQRALIETRLAAAATAGCDLAAATTLPGTLSQRNYERCGFGVLYTKLNMQRDF